MHLEIKYVDKNTLKHLADLGRQKKDVYFGMGWHNQEKIERNKAQIRHRKIIMRKLKINGCAMCGYDRCIRSLHFHHANPKDKKFNISTQRLFNHSNKEITNELNKCILLCCNCHGEIHGKN